MADDVLRKIADALLNGKMKDVESLVREAQEQKISPARILNEGLVPGMETVGAKFKCQEYYIPQVLLAARAMKAGISLIEKDLISSGFKAKAKVVIGTVRDDLHDIGKNLVATMLRGVGFDVVDLGVDVKPEQFAEAAVEGKADIVGMSALLTTTMLSMRDTIHLLKERGYAGKTIIGGAPITQDFAREIGADLFAEDAASATEVIKQAIGV
ncbi:MAG: corrinoid protein [Planctomycetes bacterium]|nr:corrinoid protein [Planctomycetota bacterium]